VFAPRDVHDSGLVMREMRRGCGYGWVTLR